MSFLRFLIVPLCAAFAAALFAHVAIDVLGDYLLPHDSYDDVAHGSRSIVLGIAIAIAGSLSAAGLSAAIREARGSADAFSRALRSSLSLPFVPFAAVTIGAAASILAFMEAVDTIGAGRAIDDFDELFGGSLELGMATLVVAALLCALCARALVRCIAGVRRTLVGAIAAAFASRAGAGGFEASLAREGVRTIATTRFTRKRRSGRAPPVLRSFDPASF